jgi:hypothetical protein
LRYNLVITYNDTFYFQYDGITELYHGHDPDDVVLNIAISKGFNKNKLISHSTSWRYDKEKKVIIVSYIVFQSGIDLLNSERIIIDKDIIKTGLSYRPAPDNISINSVLMHGLRHLEFLIKEHEFTVSPEINKALSSLRIELSGEIST